MAKVTPEQLAIQALTQALGNPQPTILYGSAKKPGFFLGSTQPVKKAVQLCLDEKWLEPTGEYDGTGKSRKEKYRLTTAGAEAAVERSEPIQLLRQALAIAESSEKTPVSIESVREELLRQQNSLLGALQKQQEATRQALSQQKTLIETAMQRFRGPTQPRSENANSNSSSAAWRDEALHHLQTYQTQHIQAFCSLPDLYAKVVQKHGVSIGEFHDAIRDLAQRQKIRLHPFTGARYALEREEYALLAGKEIMYYAERLERS